MRTIILCTFCLLWGREVIAQEISYFDQWGDRAPRRHADYFQVLTFEENRWHAVHHLLPDSQVIWDGWYTQKKLGMEHLIKGVRYDRNPQHQLIQTVNFLGDSIRVWRAFYPDGSLKAQMTLGEYLIPLSPRTMFRQEGGLMLTEEYDAYGRVAQVTRFDSTGSPEVILKCTDGNISYLRDEEKESLESTLEQMESGMPLNDIGPEVENLDEVKYQIGYPKIARDHGIGGNIVFRILVNDQGEPVCFFTLKPLNPLLDQAVAEHLMHLEVTPEFNEAGEPVWSWVNIPFRFLMVEGP